MKWIRKRVLDRELLSGTFLNLGSGLAAEIAGRAGFDYVLIDLEHGSGDYDGLLAQLLGIEGTRAAPIVRVAWNDPPRFKRVLDLGAVGVMVPWVNNADEARQAVANMLYPPAGIRGVAGWNRAGHFGQRFPDYFAEANDHLLAVVQIETASAMRHLEDIAAVDRVDVLFVGPTDLSVALGVPRQFDHPRMLEAYRAVVDAARATGRAAGILVQTEEQLCSCVDLGFTFVSVSSDGGAVASGLYRNAALFDALRDGPRAWRQIR